MQLRMTPLDINHRIKYMIKANLVQTRCTQGVLVFFLLNTCCRNVTESSSARRRTSSQQT